MSITLRRKMFKLGGETNTHGIGITSGLEYRRPGYNAGGQVEPIGSDVYPKVMGPDGQMREAHNIGMSSVLNFALAGIPKGISYLKGLITNPNVRKYGLNQADEIAAEIAKRKKMGITMGEKSMKALLDSKKALTGTQQALQAGKYLGLPGAYGLGAATALGERAGIIDPERTNVEKYGTMVGQGALDYLSVPAAVNLVAQGSFDKPGDEDASITKLSELISGKSDKAEETVGSDNDTDGGLNQKDISPAMETALTQEEQFAKMKADADARAEMYYAMLGGDGPNKVRALADAFTTAGALYDEDKSQALAGFSQGIQGELDRDEAVRDEARRLGLQEVVGLRDEERMDAKSRKQMVEQAKLAIMTSADMTPEQRQSTIRGLEAFELGVVDLLPTNDKGDEIDTGRMSPGSIYLDVNGITDGKYVAVSNDSNDPNQVDSFNNISEAEAHARS